MVQAHTACGGPFYCNKCLIPTAILNSPVPVRIPPSNMQSSVFFYSRGVVNLLQNTLQGILHPPTHTHTQMAHKMVCKWDISHANVKLLTYVCTHACTHAHTPRSDIHTTATHEVRARKLSSMPLATLGKRSKMVKFSLIVL